VLGYSPDQIAQDALDRAQDALVAASFGLQPNPGGNQLATSNPLQRNQIEQPRRVPSQRLG
jgi:hypothetical protein